MKHGQGTYFYCDGGIYEGNWKNDRMDGYGKLFYENGQLAYEGYWFQDEFHGRGKVYNDLPRNFEGSFDYTDFSEVELYWVYYEGIIDIN